MSPAWTSRRAWAAPEKEQLPEGASALAPWQPRSQCPGAEPLGAEVGTWVGPWSIHGSRQRGKSVAVPVSICSRRQTHGDRGCRVPCLRVLHGVVASWSPGKGWWGCRLLCVLLYGTSVWSVGQGLGLGRL